MMEGTSTSNRMPNSKTEPVMDVIIVGGGIAGLNCAYDLKLRDPDINILILERSGRLGGRIRSQYIPKLDHSFEAGASRISYEHNNVVKLLEHMDLASSVKPMTVQRKYMLRNNYGLLSPKNVDKIAKLYHIRSDEFPPKLYRYIDEVIEKSGVLTAHQLRQLTFQSLCQEFLTSEATQFIIDAFGYNAEFELLNAWDAIQMFNTDLSQMAQYFTVSKGLSELVYSLADKLISMGVNIHQESMLHNFFLDKDNKFKVQVDQLREGKHETYNAKNLVLALPPTALKQIPSMYYYHNELDSVVDVPLMRIYAVYPPMTSGAHWFHEIPRVTTDNVIRQIIPVDYEKGIIMISYTDSRYAKMWAGYQTQSIDALSDEVHKQLRRLFPYKRIPEPLLVKGYYWDSGCHYWRAGVNSKEMSKKILQLNYNVPLYICGEAYSHNQAWVEGALSTSLEVSKKIIPNAPEGYDKLTEKQIKANSDELERLINGEGGNSEEVTPSNAPNVNIERIDEQGNQMPKWDQQPTDEKEPTPELTQEPIQKQTPESTQETTQNTKPNNTVPKNNKPNNNSNNKPSGIRVDDNGVYHYTMKEVSKHNRPSDAWLVIDGKVYNITPWIPLHPGGKIIMQGIGKDATKLFNKIGHSQYANQVLGQYYIGELDTA